MYTTTAEAQQAAAAVAAASSSSGQQTPVDSELFNQELLARINASKPTEAKMTQAMEKLANALPGMTITKQQLSSFAETGSYFVRTGADSTASISPQVMSAMADDDEVFNKVKETIEALMSAGKSQDLTDSSGASSVQKNVVISSESARYVEVQRGKDGSTTLSVTQLIFEAWNSVNEALEMLISQVKNNRLNGSFASSSGSSFMGALSNTNFSTGSGDSGFSGLTGSDYSASWRFESYISASSSAMQTLQAQQSRLQSIEVIIEQWEASGSTSGMDFFGLMQISGLADTLVLDLGDEGINLSSAEGGVYFDINGDGTPVKTGFITGNNAFLYLDENGNGVADDISELFGDYGGYANGFEKLAQYDDNGDGVVDENDAIYSQLRVWRDLNGDGVNQEEESMSLAEAGVASLSLNHDNNRTYDEHGNIIGERSSFTRTDGSQGLMADVWLKYLK